MHYIIYKDKDLDSDIKSEDKNDDKSMTCILVVELWQGQTAMMVFYLIIVGLESIAMFGSFGFFAIWCFTVWKSHLALQNESKVFLLGFLMDFSSYNLN